MSRLKLSPEALQVQSFAVAPASQPTFEEEGSNVSECMLTCTGCTCIETCRPEICPSWSGETEAA